LVRPAILSKAKARAEGCRDRDDADAATRITDAARLSPHRSPFPPVWGV